MSMIMEGIRVVEFANFIAAPSCGKNLADWGAEVIKVEPVSGDIVRIMGTQYHSPAEADEAPLFELENGMKKGVAINTKDPEGKQLLIDLIGTADVFLTNVRERSLEKDGLDWKTLSALYPKLIMAQILGYGEEGPIKDRPAFDYTAYFARGGIAWSMQEKGTSPSNTVAALGDHYAGVQLAGGIAAALYNRMRTGKGERVTTSLFQTAIYGMGIMITTAQYGNKMPISRKKPNSPVANFYECADGMWLQLAMLQYDKGLPNFAKALEMPELLENPKFNNFKSAIDNVEELVQILDAKFKTKTRDEWEPILEQADIPYERIQTCEDILEDPQVWANEYAIRMKYRNGHEGVLTTTPVHFESMPKQDYRLSPRVGQDNDEILGAIGVTEEKLAALREKKVIV